MIEITRELKSLMKEKNLSAEEASHYIHCSAKSVFRWIRNESPPRADSRRLILAGIVRIKEAHPTTVYEMMLKARTLYRKISRHVTHQEKAELFDINRTKGTEAYIKMLEELVKRYAQDRRQVQKK